MAGRFQANDVKPSWWYFLAVDENLVSWKEIPVELPEQLKANRERLGLSQEDVAHAIFVSRQTMSSWERGKTYPDVQSLLLLSKLFGVSIDELVKGDVVAMKEMISRDALAMERSSWGAACAVLAGVACMVGWCDIWPDPSFIPHMSCGALVGIGLFIALFSLDLFLAFRIERIKNKHNLVTYKEISAFIDGRDDVAEDGSFGRRHRWLNNMVKLVCGAGFGFIVGFVLTVIVTSLN